MVYSGCIWIENTADRSILRLIVTSNGKEVARESGHASGVYWLVFLNPVKFNYATVAGETRLHLLPSIVARAVLPAVYASNNVDQHVFLFAPPICAAGGPAQGNSISSPLFGGPGGASYRFSCPDGEFIVNLSGRGGFLVDAIGAVCSNGSSFGAGGLGGGPVINQDCPIGMIGAQVWYQQATSLPFVHEILPICGGPIEMRSWGTRQTDSYISTFTCPPGMHLVGISGAAGTLVDSISFTCTPLSPLDPEVTVASPLLGGRKVRGDLSTYGFRCAP